MRFESNQEGRRYFLLATDTERTVAASNCRVFFRESVAALLEAWSGERREFNIVTFKHKISNTASAPCLPTRLQRRLSGRFTALFGRTSYLWGQMDKVPNENT